MYNRSYHTVAAYYRRVLQFNTGVNVIGGICGYGIFNFSVVTGMWSPINILASRPGMVIMRGVARILALPLAKGRLKQR